MEEILDAIWIYIEAGVRQTGAGLDYLLLPLHPLGPAVIIALLVTVTVAATKGFSRIYKTKRFVELERNFRHWHDLRQQAMACEDKEKGRALAKNIDQAQLNKAYYDYFFEGLLNNLLTKYLPILVMLAYINDAFRPAKMAAMFGRDYIFRFGGSDGDPLVVGPVFWFFVCLVSVYILWGLVKRYGKRYRRPVAIANTA